MPLLSIIPAAAVADARLTDSQVRVLCAMGTFSNKLGGNVWASVSTLAKGANLSTRTIQRALPTLIDAGYLRVVERPGRTNLYEIVLDSKGVTPVSGVTLESGGGDTGVGGGVTLESPKRYTERITSTNTSRIAPEVVSEAAHTIWRVFPKRPEGYSFAAMRKVLTARVAEGVPVEELVLACQHYAAHCLKEQTDARYVKSPLRFLSDESWKPFVETQPVVFGRTRDEWARSGQDVAEFDRLAGMPAAGVA